jgi:heme-degrading monooxygenase HmoA
MRSAKQAKASIGLLKMDTIYAGGTDFCTLTVWESKEQMLKFRDTGAHAVAMQLSSKMGEGYTTGWECDVIPDKELAEFRLKIRMNVIGKQDWLIA